MNSVQLGFLWFGFINKENTDAGATWKKYSMLSEGLQWEWSFAKADLTVRE